MKRTHNNERLIQTPRRRYKSYGDPENAGMEYPKSTARRLSQREHGFHEVNIQQERQILQRENQAASDSEDEQHNSSHNESDNSNVSGDTNESEREADMELQTVSLASTTGSDTDERNSGAGLENSFSSDDASERANVFSDESEQEREGSDSNNGLRDREKLERACGNRQSREAGEREKAADRCYQSQSLHHLSSANNRYERAEKEKSDNEPYESCLRSEAGHCLTTADGGSERAEQLRNGYDGDQERDREPDDISDNESDDGHRHPQDNRDDDVDSFASDESEDSEMEYNMQQQDRSPPNSPLPPSASANEFLRKKLEGAYALKIDDKVVASRGEILLNIQQFCKQHPLPLTAQEDLHKLINSIFYKDIVPDTTYKLDKLYKSSYGVKYFFYCSHCSENFGELPDYKTVKVYKCPRCKENNPVGDLTKAHYFVIIDFINQLQLLLEDPNVASQLKNPNEFNNNGDTLKDLHDAKMYKEFVASLDFNKGRYFISLTACTDGTPLYQSSTLSIWPIFVIVNELPPKIRMSNVLLAGLWFGRKHPNMDLFLEPFCDFIRTLSVRGFKLNICGDSRLYEAYLLAVCVDSGARGSIQCIHMHNGVYGCNWCLHPGETEGEGSNARKFLQLLQEPEARSHQQMIVDGEEVLKIPGKNNHINGVLGLSPLLRCPKFDIVNGMVLDNLHWASFGVGRRMGKLWLGETKKPKKKKPNRNANQEEVREAPPEYYVGTDETKIVINRRISKIRPPKEVRRVPRELAQLHDYNAREWENMILYFSVPIFKGILPDRFLKHWVLFAQAFYLLMKSELTKNEIAVAGNLMKKYVDQVKDLYGEKELTFNMHISNHAADNALRWGNGWSVSTYAFENGNKILKSKVHAERGIPNQLIRSLERDCSLSLLQKYASTPQSTSFRLSIGRNQIKKCFYAGTVACLRPSNFSPSREEKWLCDEINLDTSGFLECNRVIFDGVCYSVDTGKSRTDNSYALSEIGIVKIRKIISSELSGQVYLFVSKVRVRPYVLPRNVVQGNYSAFMNTVDLVEQGLVLVSCETLKTICINMPIDCQFLKSHFICVMANTRNVN